MKLLAIALALASSSASAQLARQALPVTFARPVVLTHAPQDHDRLFIAEQHTGQIRIYNIAAGTANAAPFLTISGHSTGNEQGLLGVAFHPDYAQNGHFYVNFTQAPSPGITVVRRYTVSATNPDIADPNSGETVITYSQPFSNHNGGWLAFGFDGNLHISSGDGGSANDPQGNGQSINTLLGKILRLDVNGDDFPGDPNKNYAIPPSNPFVGTPSGLDEIWHYGLRNPWRPSFDRATGALWIADVGQFAVEEIDYQGPGAAGGLNFGWRCMEGNNCTGLTGCTCNAPALTLPVHQYTHAGGNCSVTGGYAYRGCAIPEIEGEYFFADYCSNTVWSLEFNGSTVTAVNNRTAQVGPVSNITTFGEDADGELYMCQQNGVIYKIIPTAPPAACVCEADCDQSGAYDFFDYLCFQNEFAGQTAFGDCDENGAYDIFDFLCFTNAFNMGCP